MRFKENDIIFLLGAGASKDAGIPTSYNMIEKIEELIRPGEKWYKYRNLYEYVKSAIHYGAFINKKYGKNINYNIEQLVNALDELEQKEEHTLFPFIGNWNLKLVEVAGNDFENVKKFREEIVRELKEKWILIPRYDKANYYKGFENFIGNDAGDKHDQPLKIFSLNYDLCLETNCVELEIERGFKGRNWDYRVFDEKSVDENRKDIYLYKLHGSIDWARNDNGELSYEDEPSSIDINKLAVIFGTDYKMQYIDPFLFFTYQFRRWTLESKLIITIGYGYGDDHINGILGQALNSVNLPNDRLLLSISPFNRDKKEEIHNIKQKLDIQMIDQVKVNNMSAKVFLENNLDLKILSSYFPKEDEMFQEIKP